MFFFSPGRVRALSLSLMTLLFDLQNEKRNLRTNANAHIDGGAKFQGRQ